MRINHNKKLAAVLEQKKKKNKKYRIKKCAYDKNLKYMGRNLKPHGKKYIQNYEKNDEWTNIETTG